MNKKMQCTILFLLICLGVFLRFYNLRYNAGFGWDQENSIAIPAREIVVNRHFPLIGAKTGVGDLYLSPYYSYIASFFFFIFNMDPIAGSVLAAFLSIVTIGLGFILIAKIFNFSTAIYFALIWSISTLIVSLDRVAWNVNLFPIASLLVFAGLWYLLWENRSSGWILIGLGWFIGTTSHFSVVFLIAIVFLSVLLHRKILDKMLFFALFLLLIGFLPLILFDLRHGFLLSQNLLKFTKGSIVDFSKIFTHLGKTGLIVLETIGRLIYYDGFSWIQQITGLFFLFSLVILRKNTQVKKFLEIFISYLVVYLVGVALYSGSAPEYYYMGLLTVSVIGFSLLFSKVVEKFPQSFFFIIVLYSVVLARSFYLTNEINSQSLGVKQEIVRKIKEKSQRQEISVVYDMDRGWNYGYDYLFDFYGVKVIDRDSTDNTFWLSFPKNRFPGKHDFAVAEIALGFPKTSRRIFATKKIELYNHLFKLRIPKYWAVIQCAMGDFDKYLLTQSQSASCQTFDQELEGIAIYNLSGCNIWEIDEKVELKIKSGLPLYMIPGVKVSPFLKDQKVVATAFERDRCIVFKDLMKKQNDELSIFLLEILESAKK